MKWTHAHEDAFQDWLPAIQNRLNDFQKVPRSMYFYELCYCLCTPQSKAIHAEQVIKKLQQMNFKESSFDPTNILGNAEHYIRFHHTKAQRLLQMRAQYAEIDAVLHFSLSDREKHTWLVNNVNGLSNKEASHFMRNIGYRNMVILDRHILKHLVAHEVMPTIPSISTRSRYDATAQHFLDFAEFAGHSVDELDLFFWASETGYILK